MGIVIAILQTVGMVASVGVALGIITQVVVWWGDSNEKRLQQKRAENQKDWKIYDSLKNGNAPSTNVAEPADFESIKKSHYLVNSVVLAIVIALLIPTLFEILNFLEQFLD